MEVTIGHQCGSPRGARSPHHAFRADARRTCARLLTRRPQASLGLGVPYDADTTCFLTDKHSDEGKRAAPFLPSCASQAKETIQRDIYLYSADAEGKAAERSTIRARAQSGVQQLLDLQQSRRGLMLVGELSPKDSAGGPRW